MFYNINTEHSFSLSYANPHFQFEWTKSLPVAFIYTTALQTW